MLIYGLKKHTQLILLCLETTFLLRDDQKLLPTMVTFNVADNSLL